MPNYLKRFNTLVKDLEKYPYIEVVEYRTYPPVSTADLEAIETHLEIPLARPIRSFYEQTNGLKLHWRIKPNLSAEETEKLRKKSSDYYILIAEYKDDPFANINLIPIQDSILNCPGKELSIPRQKKTVDFRGHTYQKDDFRKRLKPFDLINQNYCMAYFFEDSGNPLVLLLDEGGAEWENSRLTDFESYMEMLLVTRGIVEAREKIFAMEDGNDDPFPIANSKYWQEKYTPKIFHNT